MSGTLSTGVGGVGVEGVGVESIGVESAGVESAGVEGVGREGVQPDGRSLFSHTPALYFHTPTLPHTRSPTLLCFLEKAQGGRWGRPRVTRS